MPGAQKFTIFVDAVNSPTQVTGHLQNNFRRVTATVLEAEGRRLLAELAAAPPGGMGQAPPTVEVMADQLLSIRDE